jgi:hypothetical protein
MRKIQTFNWLEQTIPNSLVLLNIQSNNRAASGTSGRPLDQG